MPGHELSTWQRIRLVLVLGSLTALGPLTIDTYLPAFPAIADDLAAAESAVQLTLTGTLIGIAAGQLLVGPVSDQLGRRRPLIGAVTVHVIVSVLCAVAPNVAILGVLRVLQGMAAAAGAVIAMAVVRDLFAGVSGVTMLSRLMLVTGVAPILAPTVGAQLLRFTDWRGIFWVLAAIGAVLIAIVTIGLRETLPPEGRRHGGVHDTVRTYGRLIRERTFIGLMLTGGLMMGALFAYISGSSFVMQEVYGLSEQDYGLMFGINSVGLVLATQINAKIAVRYGPHRVVTGGVMVATIAAAALLVNAVTGAFGLAGIVVPLFAILSMVGFTLPNVPILALANHGRSAGTAAGLIGASNFAFGAMTAPLVGAMGTSSAVPMAAVMLVATAGSLTALLFVVRPRTISVHLADHARVGRPAGGDAQADRHVQEPARRVSPLLHDQRVGAAESHRDGLLVRAGLAARRSRRPGPHRGGRRRRYRERRARSRA
ncbi:MAG TPA: multidrug effflux MFS transporter [Jiangellaceae bacterium]